MDRSLGDMELWSSAVQTLNGNYMKLPLFHTSLVRAVGFVFFSHSSSGQDHFPEITPPNRYQSCCFHFWVQAGNKWSASHSNVIFVLPAQFFRCDNASPQKPAWIISIPVVLDDLLSRAVNYTSVSRFGQNIRNTWPSADKLQPCMRASLLTF